MRRSRGLLPVLLVLGLCPAGAAPAAAQGPASRLAPPGGPGTEAPPPEAAPPPASPPTDGASPTDGAGAGSAPTGTESDHGGAPPGDAEGPGPGTEGAPSAEAQPPSLRLMVVDAATFGIDPVVGRVATDRMRQTATELGYAVLSGADTVAAWQELRPTYPPTPADLWRVSWVARVHRGAFARIWAHAGRYVIEVTVASLDGTGPFFARGTSGAEDLREVVDQLLRSCLPAPTTWSASGAEAVGGTPAPGDLGQRRARVARAPVRDEGEPTPEEAFDVEAGGENEPEASEPPAALRRWGLTAQTEAAFGASEDFFYNHLIGARLDFRITRDIIIGAYVAYANLNGRDGRASNLLVALQFEDRIRIARGLDLTLPLRASVGFLPFNGPVIRLAAGLNYAVSPSWTIGADLLAPTFWILQDRTSVSLDVAIEATYWF